MDETSALILHGFATATLFGDVIIILLLLLLAVFYFTNKKTGKSLVQLIGNNATSFALLIVSMATLGSLYSSEIALLAPCKLCWLQRIFMFPLPILLVVSLLSNDKRVKKYVLPIAGIGLTIAIYHILLQLFPAVVPECSTEGVSCSTPYATYYGYITVPVMSATAFALVIISFLFPSVSKK